MARQVIVQVFCDVCESPDGAAPLEFSVDRSSFEIDLCEKHRAEFSAAIGTFVARARSARGRTAARPSSSPAPARGGARREAGQTESIRQWAKENGFAISDRGRIPGHVEAAYHDRTA